MDAASASSAAAGRGAPASAARPRSRFAPGRLVNEYAAAESVSRFGRAAAISVAMREVFELLGRLAPLDVPVTLSGETGTGKDVLARAVHERSSRACGPFVVFDCGKVAASVAESELLGHERGAFTGAIHAEPGAFERAHGGTLFLDEIGALRLDLQAQALRALERRTVRRVGGRQDRSVDVRVIAATTRDLQAEVGAGRFRSDLFFRLAGAQVLVPALRDRLDDLPHLVNGLLSELGRPDVEVAGATQRALRAHAWPGNVRELENTLACAMAFVESGRLEPEHLRLTSSRAEDSVLEWLPLAGQRLERIEKVAIKLTLAQVGGNKVQAARSLGIAVSTLYEKLKKYELT